MPKVPKRVARRIWPTESGHAVILYLKRDPPKWVMRAHGVFPERFEISWMDRSEWPSLQEIVDWLVTNARADVVVLGAYEQSDFYFCDWKDRLLFKLRWSDFFEPNWDPKLDEPSPWADQRFVEHQREWRFWFDSVGGRLG